MMSGAYFGVSNVQMIELMFRPLYWFGVGYTPDLNPGLSVADRPCTQMAVGPSPSI